MQGRKLCCPLTAFVSAAGCDFSKKTDLLLAFATAALRINHNLSSKFHAGANYAFVRYAVRAFLKPFPPQY